MPLSWNEIRDRAIAFSKEWEGEERERAEAQSFWNDFFEVFGISRKRVAAFEKQVDLSHAKRKLKGGRIDAFWKGVLLIEHKSAGKDLDKAFGQAIDYFDGLPERDLPSYILVSDFARFRLYDIEGGQHWEFPLKDLHKHIKRFNFIAGYAPQEIKPQDPVNIKAAEQMGRLHDQLKASGYTGHGLEVLLVRLVFCLFADDTGIFSKQSFRDWIEARTQEDGSDLGPQLALLFQVLNTPKEKRQKNLDEQLTDFAYINGKLFDEALRVASFDGKMRAALLDCCKLNWGSVSPAIFGALFQSIMDEKDRRNLGAHYTSEENILKLIKPLFLDDLWAEFRRVKGNKNRLFELHKKLRTLNFFDPACGCGNFLVITYRELRLLELEILRAVHSGPGSRFLNVHQEIQLDVDQFYGIEIEEFPAQIAQVALWLIDHQMNQKVSEEFGMYFARIPLVSTPRIHIVNALTTDWETVLPPDRASFVLGNPPFVGAKFLTEQQRADARAVFRDLENAGQIDYVGAWYVKAVRYMREAAGGGIRCAFVSTSSITQGEQVPALWPWLLSQGLKVHFAHRTFSWANEASGVAAVHCVIIGFALYPGENCIIFDYQHAKGEPHAVRATNINPYLLDGEDIVIAARSAPLTPIPLLYNGSIPADGGFLILSESARNQLIREEPAARRWIRPYQGGEDFINSTERYCLWLVDCPPDVLKEMSQVLARVRGVRDARLASPKQATRQKAATPTLFTEIRQPKGDRYLAIPRTSSENRRYIPIGFLPSTVIAANDLQIVPDASDYEFAILSSAMHMAWMKLTSGRLESRYRYSAKYTYNTFPWPEVTQRQRAPIEERARAVLDARRGFPKSSLGELYDQLSMPPALNSAHIALDRMVDAAYGCKTPTDPARLAILLDRYTRHTSLLPSRSPRRRRKANSRGSMGTEER